jgi:four helix bundle protein
MGKITKVYDLEIYQEALKLTKEIFELCKHPLLKHEYELVNQIKDACMSVCVNIAEGFGRYSSKDFAHFLSISLGSCNETNAFLDVIHINFPVIKVAILQERYLVLSKRIYAFREYIQTNKHSLKNA